QSPIATSFGFKNTETGFEKGAAPGNPEYWLAFEGTPIAPGLTARGNLKAPGLVEPDFFLIGNWTDYTAQGIVGLASVLWKGRLASGLDYTDSAVMLLWDEENFGPGFKKVKASTEIGIVDSLKVARGIPGTLGEGVVYAGIGKCMSFETVVEQPCGVAGYSPYTPDSLQTLFLVTNTLVDNLDNVRLEVGSLPQGISVANATNPVIPASLLKNTTGVGTVSFKAEPRLQTAEFTIPVAIMSGADTLLKDEICLIVPGLQGEITAVDNEFLPLCPGLSDTIDVVVQLEGVRCLPIEKIEILGSPRFSLITPLPTVIPANGIVNVRVQYNPLGVNNGETAQIAVAVRDSEKFPLSDTAFVIIRDTATIRGLGKEAEFFFANMTDTLDFGQVCIGDTALKTWEIKNTGGCEVIIVNPSAEGGRPNQFSIANMANFPLAIPRNNSQLLKDVVIRFTPLSSGSDIAKIIIRSTSQPLLDTLIVRGIGDSPRYEASASSVVDTICPGEPHLFEVEISNPTACDVPVNSLDITSATPGFSVAPASSFVIPPFGTITARVSGIFAQTGEISAQLNINSAAPGMPAPLLKAVVASRILESETAMSFGEVRVKEKMIQPFTFRSMGTVGVEITALKITGSHVSDFVLKLPAGVTFPLFLKPNDAISGEVEFTPSELEDRRAFVVAELNPRVSCEAPEPILLKGRGILPVVDVPRKFVDLGRICVGEVIDTVITVRNIGNAAFTIDEIFASGATDFSIREALPLKVDSSAQRKIAVRFTPTKLGNIATELRFKTNGTWFTAPDTVMTFSATGVVCGTLSIDTVRAQVGSVVEIPVRFKSKFAGVDAAQLMNNSNVAAMNISILHKSDMLRFKNETITHGMLQNANAQMNVTPSSLYLRTNNSASMASGNVFAVLKADVLLGENYSSELVLKTDEFANGFSNIELKNGMLIGEYCAFENRLVDASEVQLFLRMKAVPSDNGNAELYVSESSEIEIAILDMFGNPVGATFKKQFLKGLHEVEVPIGDLPSGRYTVLLKAGSAVIAEPLVLVR
ncbi:MAG TPA: choice-of-anchor D domain-containing protein, partial [Patescibacteria group bacterium]|nr:choice-of-anchor D domain-containing protein [Patescibacteria group bacterium]